MDQQTILVAPVDRVGVARITGIVEGTNSWTFLMRGDWDDHFSVNGFQVPTKANPRLPWVQAFAYHRLTSVE